MYGRQIELTSYERQNLTCREIDLEIAKCKGFLAYVDKESEFDFRSVMSFFGDLGIGNTMEKSRATKSANVRMGELRAVHDEKHCVEVDISPSPDRTVPQHP
jgi:hypothetical protein